MKTRTSGTQSEKTKVGWARRRGNPGGPRSESQKAGAAPLPLAPKVDDVIPAAMQAFLIGDEDRLRELFSLNAWDNSPLVDFDADPGALKTEGDARAHALRRRIIRRIETLGRLRFADLDDDGAAGDRAWRKLNTLARRLGLDIERGCLVAQKHEEDFSQ